MHLYKNNRISPYRGIFITIIIFVVFYYILGSNFLNASSDIENNNVVILKDAIDKAVSTCYAIEGTYPEDITYLEKHYGIVVDREKFIVEYSVIGANIKPSVFVYKIDKDKGVNIDE
jgi:hypothetical protein